MIKLGRRIILVIVILVGLIGNPVMCFAIEKSFEGEGTPENPYIIASYEDLRQFRDLVNQGNTFEGKFFYQIVDIDLHNEEWIPIGNVEKNSSFFGVYNGAGHTIQNLKISNSVEYAGFFGELCGIVANLGIESGNIQGQYAGAIASTSGGERALIINCYNKAKITGQRAGGIADYFVEGTIANCWSTGELEGETLGGIVSYGGDVKIYSCFTTSPWLCPSDVSSTTSYSVDESFLYSNSFAKDFSFRTALGQYMFLDSQEVKLLQWELNQGELKYSDEKGYLQGVGFLNLYLLPIIVLIFIFIGIVKFRNIERKDIWKLYSKQVTAICIIAGIISNFVDTALVSKGAKYLNWGNATFIVLINLIFWAMLICLIKYSGWRQFKFKKEWIPLGCVIVFVLILEYLQFDIVPSFDASLYYGSFVKAISCFRIDLLSFIGAFVCWKWAHGLALLIAPIEFFMPGNIIGVYISNMVITAVTIVCLYWLIKNIYSSISNTIATLCCAVFMFSPYVLGLFTYLCMDWHLIFFMVWLLCSVKKKNNLMISFCGFLLAFTKITGLVFYVFLLFMQGLFEMFENNGDTLWKKIACWWNWKKVLLWVSPVFAFLISLLYGDHLTIQNFYGASDTSSMIEWGNFTRIYITFIQTFVYGFRWLFFIGIVVSIVIFLIKRSKLDKIITKENTIFLVSIAIAYMGVFAMLCIHNGDAECPRYTAIFTLLYALSLPFVLLVVFKKEYIRNVVIGAIAILLMIQTYWTIDPSILQSAQFIDTGKIQLHKLASLKDERLSMNLGTNYGPGHHILCDLYAYNIQYNYYSDLLDKLLEKINPTEKDTFYVLDLFEYEIHLSGSANRNYKIYWNPRQKKRTYDEKNNIYLDSKSITTDEVVNLVKSGQKELNKFYIIVVPRVDEREAIEAISKSNYMINNEIDVENLYGSMKVYEVKRKM